jgi:hypothetical protein
MFVYVGDNNISINVDELNKLEKELNIKNTIFVNFPIFKQKIGNKTIISVGNDRFKPCEEDLKKLREMIQSMDGKNFVVTAWGVYII